MKHSISIRVDEKIWAYIKNKPNRSRYIEELIREDLQTTNSQGIYEALTARILSDNEYLPKLALKLSQTGSKDVVLSQSESVQVVSGDWGA